MTFENKSANFCHVFSNGARLLSIKRIKEKENARRERQYAKWKTERGIERRAARPDVKQITDARLCTGAPLQCQTVCVSTTCTQPWLAVTSWPFSQRRTSVSAIMAQNFLADTQRVAAGVKAQAHGVRALRRGERDV